MLHTHTMPVQEFNMFMPTSQLEALAKDRPLLTPEIHQSNDFYGHAVLLKRFLGIAPHYPLKVALEHGPTLNEYVWDADLRSPCPFFLCANNLSQRLYTERCGRRKKAIAIGPYIAYLQKVLDNDQHRVLQPRTLLVFPHHSTHHYIVHYDLDPHMKLIAERAKRFDRVVVCVYWKDILRGLHHAYLAEGFDCVTAGHMFDPNFLFRLYSHITQASAAISFFPGTDVLYSVLLGKPVWLVYDRKATVSSGDALYENMRQEIDASDRSAALKMVELFSEPRDSLSGEQVEFVREATGFHNLKSQDELMAIILEAEERFSGARGVKPLPIPRVKPAASENRETMARAVEPFHSLTASDPRQNGRADSSLSDLQATHDDKLHKEYFSRKGQVGSSSAELQSGTTELIEREGGLVYEQAWSVQNAAKSAADVVPQGASTGEAGCPRSSRQQAVELMRTAIKALDAHDTSSAFNSIIKAKAMRTRVEGLDYLRAVCFLKLNQTAAAKEALNEELRAFPNNTGARALLSHILSQSQKDKGSSSYPDEFNQLLNVLRPYTMLSEKRLYSLFAHAKHVCEKNLAGNFVECGVAAGGSTALLAYVAKRYSRVPRTVFAFDSFEGMPEPTAFDKHMGQSADDTGWGTGTCSASEKSVREICAKLGVLDMVSTVKGYFEHTLPDWRDRVGMIALLHLDGDWYESTKSILAHLYDRVTSDGILQVDDYGYWEGCKRAIHEFEAERRVRFELKSIDGTGVWCTKPDRFPANPAIRERMIAEFNQVDPVPMGIEGQMSVNERFQLYYALSELLPRKHSPVRFVEVGSYAGGSLALTYMTLRRTSDRVQGFCVEPSGQPSLFKVLEHAGPAVAHLPMLSFQAAPRLRQVFADGNRPEFIFIDGDHSYEGVKRDIIDYYPLLAPGGLILFHDYLPVLDDANREAILAHHGGKEPGIRQACVEIMEEQFGCVPIDLPLLYPTDPTQTQAHLPIIPGVFSTVRAYRKPEEAGSTDSIHTVRTSSPKGSSSLKVVHLCSSEKGGAGRAAYRLHAGLRKAGVNSTLLVLEKTGSDPSVKLVPPTRPGVSAACLETPGISPAWHAANNRWQHLLTRHPARPAGLEIYSDARADVHLDSIAELRDADIVNLHWVAGMIDYRSVAGALKGKQIVWTLHDMNPFTGGCHYAGSCGKYEEFCHACPQLGPSELGDLARYVWEAKYHALRDLDITVVAPSRWLARCAAQSAIFTGRTVHCIPYGIDTETFRPWGKEAIRKRVDIPLDARVVLFGADSVVNTRKGFQYLVQAVAGYRSRRAAPVVLATFGGIAPRDAAALPYPTVNLGYVSSDLNLAQVYSMADLFVLPALADNLPNTVLEAMACGVPVVGFDIGGIPDMIEHKQTGFLAKPGSVESLMEGIDWTLFAASQSELSRSCRQRVVERFALPLQAAGYARIYRELAGEKAQPIAVRSEATTCTAAEPVSADLCLNSVFSWPGVDDYLALQGDFNSILQKGSAPRAGGRVGEPERQGGPLAGLGAAAEKPDLLFDFSPDDLVFASRCFREHGLDPKKTVILFAGAQHPLRVYDHYGTALQKICREYGFSVMALGAAEDFPVNRRNLEAMDVRSVNLSGQVSLRRSAALVRSCRLVVGAETGLAHIACAVRTAHVMVLGGGHVGRFMPYARSSSLVCLPLECCGCNWQCRYGRAHCVGGVAPAVMEEAIRRTLVQPSEKPRVFVQGPSLWNPVPGEPRWKSCDPFLAADGVDVVVLPDRRRPSPRKAPAKGLRL